MITSQNTSRQPLSKAPQRNGSYASGKTSETPLLHLKSLLHNNILIVLEVVLIPCALTVEAVVIPLVEPFPGVA